MQRFLNQKNNIFVQAGIVALFVSVFIFSIKTFAAPPGSPYAPGATLDPNCAPGDTNCSVAVGDISQASSGTQATGQIPFWTATGKQISKGTTSFFWDATNSRLGIGTSTPTGTLTLIGQATNGAPLLEVTGVAAGDSTPGSGITLTSADGGTSLAATAGSGGNVDITSGSGSTGFVSNSSAGVISIAGGDGGGGNTLNGKGGGGVGIYGGEGGFSSAAAGGAGGNISLIAGEAGQGVSGTVAKGGDVTIFSGNGGSVSAGTNPNGGDIALSPGSVGLGGSGGRDGNILLAYQRGLVGIGLNNPSYQLHVKGDNGTGNVAKFETTSGATACTLSATTGLLNCSSDVRLKKDIENIGTVLDKMIALRPVSYRWKTDDSDAELKYGFIAQEIEEQFPSTVTTDHETGYKLFSLQGLVPYIVKSIKELNAKVDALSGNVSSQVTQVIQSVLPSLTVGSSEAPTGITLYDKTTSEPYCFSINNGASETTPGACQ